MKKTIKFVLFTLFLLTIFMVNTKNIFAEANISQVSFTVAPNFSGENNDFIVNVSGQNLDSLKYGYISYANNETGLEKCSDIENTKWVQKTTNSNNTKLDLVQRKEVNGFNYGPKKIKVCLKDESNNIIESNIENIYINSGCRVTDENHNTNIKASFYCPSCEHKNVGTDFLNENEDLRIQTYPFRDYSSQGVCLDTKHKIKISIKQNDNLVFSKKYDFNQNPIQNYLKPKGDYCENTSDDDCIECSVIGTIDIFAPNNPEVPIQTITTDTKKWNCLNNDKIKEVWEDNGGGSTSAGLIENCKNSLAESGAVSFTALFNDVTDSKTILSINTKDCKNIPLKISFPGSKGALAWTTGVLNEIYNPASLFEILDVHASIDDKSSGKTLTSIDITPIEDKVTLTLILNDDVCYGGNKPDCIIPAVITSSDTDEILNKKTIDATNIYWDKYDKEDDKQKLINITHEAQREGAIIADCSSKYCDDDNWSLLQITGALESTNYPQSVGTTQVFDPDNPCYDSSLNDGNGGYDENCYEFLAPFGGIENGPDSNMFKVQTDKNGVKRIAIKNIRDYELGNYINKLFQVAIAILGVISVIMIIIAGVQYMTVESIYGKSDAKQHIIGAISGLLLAISIFVILKTINPKLLEVNFGEGIDHVSIEDGDGPVEYDSIKHTAKHPKYNYSGDWPPTSENFKTIRKGGKNSTETIISGVYVKNKECDYVGDSCTSLYFDNTSYNMIINGLTKLKQDSGANKIIITGGSEYWLHKTHGPKSAVLDIRSSNSEGNDSPSINKYLVGSKKYPGQCYEHMGISSYINSALDENGNGGGTLCDKENKRYPPPQEVINARKSPIQKKINTTTKKRSCCWNSSQHWHIVFK